MFGCWNLEEFICVYHFSKQGWKIRTFGKEHRASYYNLYSAVALKVLNFNIKCFACCLCLTKTSVFWNVSVALLLSSYSKSHLLLQINFPRTDSPSPPPALYEESTRQNSKDLSLVLQIICTEEKLLGAHWRSWSSYILMCCDGGKNMRYTTDFSKSCNLK